MPTIIAICSQKGGVGKTTISINLACAWALSGRSTLLVDADPQGGVARSLSGRATRRRGTQELLHGQCQLQKVIIPSKLKHFSVLPAGTYNIEQEADPKNWQQLISQLRQLDQDIILLDCPPGLSADVREILQHADHYLTPQQAEPLSLRSLVPFLSAIIRHTQDADKLAGVLLNMVDSQHSSSSRLSAELRQLIPNKALLNTEIPRDPQFLEACQRGVPLAYLSDPSPPSSSLFQQLVIELERRLNIQSHNTHGKLTQILD